MKDHAQTDSSQVIALLLGVFVLLAALLFVSIRSKAAEGGASDTQVTISAATPTIAFTAHQQSGLALTDLLINEGGLTTTALELTFSDNNGCQDVLAATSTVELVIFDNNLWTGAGCASNGTNSSTCMSFTDAYTQLAGQAGGNTCTGGSDVDVSYIYTIPWEYFASSTTGNAWSVGGFVTDGTDNDSEQYSNIHTFDVTGQTYMSLASSTVNFGSLALGASAQAAAPLVMTNTGNDPIDLSLTVDDMTCDEGSIDADFGGDPGEIRTSLTDETFAAMSDDGSIAANVKSHNDFSLESVSSRTDTATKSLYWSIQIPTTGVGGTCNGGITLTADANA